MNYPPTVSDFQAYFVREFNYQAGKDYVTPADITRALGEVLFLFNQNLFDTTALASIGYLYAAAHFLRMNIEQAGGLSAIPRGRGARNSAVGVIVSAGVGQVNVVYQVPPQRIAESPALLPFFRTDFGQRYIQMVIQRLYGNAFVVCGPNANWPSPE